MNNKIYKFFFKENKISIVNLKFEGHVVYEREKEHEVGNMPLCSGELIAFSVCTAEGTPLIGD